MDSSITTSKTAIILSVWKFTELSMIYAAKKSLTCVKCAKKQKTNKQTKNNEKFIIKLTFFCFTKPFLKWRRHILADI